MPTLKSIAAIVALSAAASLYAVVMGEAAIQNSARQLVSSSQGLADQWSNITHEFAIDRRKTSPGELAPVVAERFSALDLAVYGAGVVNPPFKPLFESAGLEPMFDEIYMRSQNGALEYYAGGIQLAGLKDIEGNGVAVLFYNMPGHLRRAVTNALEGHPGKIAVVGESSAGQLSALVLPYTRLSIHL